MTDPELIEELRTLRARIESLEAQVEATAEFREPEPIAAQPVGTRPFSRRRLMRQAGTMAIAGVGAAAAATLVAPRPVAAVDYVALGSVSNTASQPTGIAVTQASGGTYGFGVTDQGLNSLPGSASLFGHANGSYQAAVMAYQQALDGTALSVLAENPGGIGATITGRAKGIDVYGGTAAGVTTRSQFDVGIHARSDNDRGGYFQSGTYHLSDPVAQIRLAPGKHATHPTDGLTGDLFVDKSGRLWYCKKGGTAATWKQVA